MDRIDMMISWDAVTQTIFDTPIEPDFYLVFYNGSPDEDSEYYFFHGATTGLSYTHQQVGQFAEHMFYRVRSYKYYGTRSLDLSRLNLLQGMSEREVLEMLQELDK